MKLKVMSYNIQHCEHHLYHHIDFDAVADVIRRQNVDIIGLNEVRGKGKLHDYKAQAKALAKRLGFYYYFAEAIRVHGVNPYGNAILSRYPIVSAETVPIPDPKVRTGSQMYETRCLLKATVQADEPWTVLVTHFGLNHDEHLCAVDTVVPQIADSHCILMGDFNAEPDAEILLPIREKMRDCSDRLTGNRLSFPSHAPVKKIDYIFVTPDTEILSADIPHIIVSDHCPHTAWIENK